MTALFILVFKYIWNCVPVFALQRIKTQINEWGSQDSLQQSHLLNFRFRIHGRTVHALEICLILVRKERHLSSRSHSVYDDGHNARIILWCNRFSFFKVWPIGIFDFKRDSLLFFLAVHLFWTPSFLKISHCSTSSFPITDNWNVWTAHSTNCSKANSGH